MQPTLFNDFYIATNSRVGPWSLLNGAAPSAEQEVNANIIRSFFLNEGWTINAICGMLGCMQGESTINPALIEQTNRWRLPNQAADLSDVPNSVAKNYYNLYYGVQRRGFGIGIVQWDGYSEISPNVYEQKMVTFAIANNIIWYDGWTQLYKLRYEQNYDVTNQTHIFFYPVRYSGIVYTFDNFPYSTASPEILAAAWTSGYERNAGGVGYRDENARYWFNFFTGPNAPAIIPPEDFNLPTPADPVEPPFDPDHPIDPAHPVNRLPNWVLSVIIKRRKEMLLKWRKV